MAGAPLQERPGLHSADAGPAAALEMVRDWVLRKQCRKALPPCMQTDPAAGSTVGLRYLEVGWRVSTVNKSRGPGLRAAAQPWEAELHC